MFQPPMNISQQTLAAVSAAVKNSWTSPINKADTTGISLASGLQYYDLQPAAKLLYPVLAPLRNETPRVKGNGGDSTNWKAILGVNVGHTSMGVSEGRRNAVMITRTADYLAKYATIGLENNVTDESVFAAEGFDDVKALAVRNLLQAVIIGEEGVLLGGNSSLALGVTPTPTLATATTGGALPATTPLSVIAVALTYEGFQNSSLVSGIPAQISRTNADGSVDAFGGGSAQKSAAATVTTGATATNSITASVAPVRGAAGYAWFWGAAGSETLGAITTLNSILITDNASGSQTAASLPTADNSKNGLVFDGYLTQIMKPDSGAYYYAMPTGTPGVGKGLTPDGAAGITELDNALAYFWDNYKVSPDEILCNSREVVNLTRKIIASGGSPMFRFNVDAQQGQVSDVTLTAGAIVGQYLNKFGMSGGQLIPIRVHPTIPPGMIMFRKKTIPYPMSNVNNVAEVRYQQDYYQAEWPRRTRAYEYGVYARELLALYAPFCFGVITNIGDN